MSCQWVRQYSCLAGSGAQLVAELHRPACRYFLRKLRRVKKANGQILSCNEVSLGGLATSRGGAWAGMRLPGGRVAVCGGRL